MNRLARLALLLGTLPAFAHDTGKQSQSPSKAQPYLDQASRLNAMLKKKAAQKGLHQCCLRKTAGCDLCVRTRGACHCAANVANGKGGCGECVAGWRSGSGDGRNARRGSIDLFPAPAQSLAAEPPDDEIATLIREIEDKFLQAKRVLVEEKRYGCCMQGGCAQCARERNCPCGGDLAKGRGVCGECLDAWHSGRGAFPGIDPKEVQLATMEPGEMETAGMGPGGGPMSGWYASGTSQQPRETGMNMATLRTGAWSVMGSGQAFLVYTEQSGPRGKSKLFSPNWGMLMASRRLGPGTLTLRSMLSLEPATIPGKRYPLLFATGETANGVPIVNGQHPHDLFMELAASYQIRLGERTAITMYGGPRGEPALGPPAFPHRASASENPIAVIAHHIQDSTHVSNNVVTAGITHRAITWEVSGFQGREPDEHRWGLDRGPIDSLATRLTITPTSRWSGQVSMGRLNNREVTHPGRPALRTTASVSYSRQYSRGTWATTLIWGRNHDLAYTQQPSVLTPVLSRLSLPGRTLRPQHFTTVPTRIPGQIYNSYLAESTLRFGGNWLWGRVENADRDSTLLYEESPLVLLVDERRLGRMQAFTAGYERELTSSTRWLRPGLGAQLMVYRAPPALAPVLNANPIGVQVFLKVRFGQVARTQ